MRVCARVGPCLCFANAVFLNKLVDRLPAALGILAAGAVEALEEAAALEVRKE
jgi:hypothetical protein